MWQVEDVFHVAVLCTVYSARYLQLRQNLAWTFRHTTIHTPRFYRCYLITRPFYPRSLLQYLTVKHSIESCTQHHQCYHLQLINYLEFTWLNTAAPSQHTIEGSIRTETLLYIYCTASVTQQPSKAPGPCRVRVKRYSRRRLPPRRLGLSAGVTEINTSADLGVGCE